MFKNKQKARAFRRFLHTFSIQLRLSEMHPDTEKGGKKGCQIYASICLREDTYLDKKKIHPSKGPAVG